MKYTKYFLFAIMLLILPCVVKADTWLDDPSYRDTSWFDPTTYDTVYDYTIDSPEKLAGLLYLVNEEGYTFEQKRIKIVPNVNADSSICIVYYGCEYLDISAHEWVPFKSYFLGGFANSYSSEYIYAESNYNEIKFVENNYCQSFTTRNGFQDMNCSSFFHVKYNMDINANEGGSVEVLSGGLSGYITVLGINLNDGYNIISVEVKDYEGNVIQFDTLNKYNNAEYRFSTPNKKVSINVIFEKKPGEKCVVLNGTGKDIGDEVACGKEHFYVIDYNDTETKMLAKYNLYAGKSILKKEIIKESGDSRTDDQYCQDLATSMGGIVKNGSSYTLPGYCLIAVDIIEEEFMRQNEQALSAHWDKDNNYIYPQVGDVYLSGFGQSSSNNVSSRGDFYIDESSGVIYDNNFYDLFLGDGVNHGNSNGNIFRLLNAYKDTLLFDGIDVKNINLLSLDEINNVIKRNNKSIPYAEWRNSTANITPPHYEFAYLNDYLTDKQSFIYGTTYWLRTGYDKVYDYFGFGIQNVVFVNTYGGVCGSLLNRVSGGGCGTSTLSISSSIGAGIRPVITIASDDLEFAINTETDDNGEIEVINYAQGDTPITFKVNGKRGFKLGTLIVRTSSGEEIEFFEGELITNEDGTVSIANNKFTMPYESVTLVANWVSTNPDTGITILKYIVILFVCFNGLLLMYDNKDKIKYLFRYQ